jgi:hypothetical protein
MRAWTLNTHEVAPAERSWKRDIERGSLRTIRVELGMVAGERLGIVLGIVVRNPAGLRH